MAAAGLRRGSAKPAGAGRHWSGRAESAGLFDSKADALSLLDSLGVPAGSVQFAPGGPSFLHPGRSLTFRMGPKNVLGFCGELHPDVLRVMDASGPMACFEIILDALPMPRARATKARPKIVLSDLMPAERDFAFVVDRSVAAGDLLAAARLADRTLVSDASVFDVYQGPGMPEGKKSVALTVVLQPSDKTLTEPEIEGVSAKIVQAVAKRTGAVLRG